MQGINEIALVGMEENLQLRVQEIYQQSPRNIARTNVMNIVWFNLTIVGFHLLTLDECQVKQGIKILWT